MSAKRATPQPAAAANPITFPALAVAESFDFPLPAGGAERDCTLHQIPGYREGTAGRVCGLFLANSACCCVTSITLLYDILGQARRADMRRRRCTEPLRDDMSIGARMPCLRDPETGAALPDERLLLPHIGMICTLTLIS